MNLIFLKLIIILNIIALAYINRANATPCLQIGFYESPFNSQLIPVLRELYQSAGLCFEAVIAPSKRLVQMIKSGSIDGEFGRANIFFSEHNYSLIKIEPPILRFYGVYVTKNKIDKTIWSKSLLRGKKIASIRGVFWSDSFAKKQNLELFLVQDANQLTKMLEYSRIDGFLTDTLTLKLAILANKINPEDYWVSPSLVDLSVYHYLISKHYEVAPRLKDIINSYTKSGLLDDLIEKEVINDIEPVVKYDISSSNAWYPFIFEKSTGETVGILIELIQEILKRAKIKGLPVKLGSETSGQEALELKEVDLDIKSPSWMPNGKFDDKYFISKNILSVDDVVIMPKGSREAKDLGLNYSEKVGTIKGYDYYDQKRLKRVDFENEKELIIAVSNSDVKQGIIGKLAGLYWSDKLKIEVTFGAVHTNAPLVLRMHKHLTPYKERVNSAIEQIIADGTLQKILDKYLTSQGNRI
ncbi:substrate-binding periplasmic protein [Zooshikella ganghwensis]|uniref:substrate-binding periplasmic protein n=1 Tax=Zooshikella ganghwensis TaxID=202772 RepID=UPI00041688F2|nr:transporter substrate-binding domain-containing protein [Zooshikella ganghwensis]